MAEKLEVKELDQVVVRFSGDSGDGMQLAGNIFSTVSATVGNGISTFPDYILLTSALRKARSLVCLVSRYILVQVRFTPLAISATYWWP